MNPIYDKKRKINEPDQQQPPKRPSWRNTNMEHDNYSNISTFHTSTPINSWDYHYNNNRGYNNPSYEQHLNHDPNLFHSNRNYNEHNWYDNNYQNEYSPRSSYGGGAYYNQLDHNRNPYDNYYPPPIQPPIPPFYTSTSASNINNYQHCNDRSSNDLIGRYNDNYYSSSNIATNSMIGSSYNEQLPFHLSNLSDPFYEPQIYNRYNNPMNINRNSINNKMNSNTHKTRQYSFGNKKANKDISSIKSPSSIKSSNQNIAKETPKEIEKPKVIQSVAIKDYLNLNMALLDYHISVSLLKLGIKYEKKTESFLIVESITTKTNSNIIGSTENKSLLLKGKTSTNTVIETKNKHTAVQAAANHISQPIQQKNLENDVNNNISNSNISKQQISITKPPLPSATKRTSSVPILNKSITIETNEFGQKSLNNISKQLPNSSHKTLPPQQNQPLPPPQQNQPLPPTFKRIQTETYTSQPSKSSIQPSLVPSSSSSLLNTSTKQARGISPTPSHTSTGSGLKVASGSRSNNSKDRDIRSNNTLSNYNYDQYYDNYDNRYPNNYMYGADYTNIPSTFMEPRGTTGYTEHDTGYYNHNSSTDNYNNGYHHYDVPYINPRNNNRVDHSYDYSPSYYHHQHQEPPLPPSSHRNRSTPPIHQPQYLNNNMNYNNNNSISNPNVYSNNTPKTIEKRIDNGIINIQSNNKSKKSSPGTTEVQTKPPLPPAILKTPR